MPLSERLAFVLENIANRLIEQATPAEETGDALVDRIRRTWERPAAVSRTPRRLRARGTQPRDLNGACGPASRSPAH